MTSIYFGLLLTGACVPIITVIFAWNLTGWSWKARPLVPMLLGVVILVLALGANIYLSRISAQIRDHLADSPRIEAKVERLLSETVSANEQLSKLLELLTIPLGVSLIATSLLSKADLEFKRHVSQYEGSLRALHEHWQHLDQLERDFEAALAKNVRGSQLIQEWTRLKDGRLGWANAERELRRQYELLLKENFVAPLSTGSTRATVRSATS